MTDEPRLCGEHGECGMNGANCWPEERRKGERRGDFDGDGFREPNDEHRECVRCLERKPDVWDRTGEQSDLCDDCVGEMVREYALEQEARAAHEATAIAHRPLAPPPEQPTPSPEESKP